mmetsp:Transcript_26776/g.62146  ORF Transcript_26776/g.62146 Transcript_26776/m.62146 type:complete len:301 (+) Transcript_26776:1936-2838(+)
MGFVHDNCAVSVQVRLEQGFTQKHSIRHVLDDGLLASAIFETNRVADLGTQFACHLISHALCHGHSRDSSGLRAANLAIDRVACLVQVLSQLCCLPRTCLANTDDDVVLPQEVNELLPDLEDWQALPLLLDGSSLGKLTLSLGLLIFQRQAVLVARLGVELIVRHVIILFVIIRLLLHAHDVAHVGSCQLPEALSKLALVLLFTDLPDHFRALLAENRHVRRGIFHSAHCLRLGGEHFTPVEEGRRRISDDYRNTFLFVFLGEVEVHLLPLCEAHRSQPVELPKLICFILHLLPNVHTGN